MSTPVKQKHGLFTYYQEQALLPTFANLKNQASLNKYTSDRIEFLSDKLYLLPQFFNNCELIEFGPDSGENALVFASLGANLTLVEPNRNAHPLIKEYFNKYSMNLKLRDIIAQPLENFHSNHFFDIIIAEGFIDTIQPTSIWLSLFNKILKDNGLFIISYYDKLGSFIELILKAIFTYVKANSVSDSLSIANLLYRNKWDSINHTRSIESWVMDVLDNPYVRLLYFLQSDELIKDCSNHGFKLYSSWPVYKNNNSIYWHKKIFSEKYHYRKNRENILRHSLGYLLGKNIYIANADNKVLSLIHKTLHDALINIDTFIEHPQSNQVNECLNSLKRIKEIVSNKVMFITSNEDYNQSIALLNCLEIAFRCIEQKNINELINFCNTNSIFINEWGMPHHFAVLRKYGCR